MYHIYHSGPFQKHFSVHLVPDSTCKPPPKKKKGKNEKNTTTDPAVVAEEGGEGEGGEGEGEGNGKKRPTSRWFWHETEIDSRVPLYFLHEPRLNKHMPGMTLRWGGDGRDYLREKYIPPWKQAEKEKKKGKEKESKKKIKPRKRDMKYAPVVCHIEGDLVWRKWELEFTVLVPHPEDPVLKQVTNGKTLLGSKKEVQVFKGKSTKDKSNWVYRGLNEPGVVDGRGLISTWYPFKKKLFSWRGKGETGKEWVEREVARRAYKQEGGAVVRRESTSDIVAAENEGDVAEVVDQEQDQQSGDDHPVLLPPEKIPRHLWPIQLDPVPSFSTSTSATSPLPTSSPTTKQRDPNKGPPNPSKLTLVWSHILCREYEFTYLSTSFYWRGTRELNHYLEPDSKDPQADAAMRKRAVEEARKKKGVDLCIWAHLKLVVLIPRRVVEAWRAGDGEEGKGLGLGLLGKKRRTGSWGVGLGIGTGNGEGPAEGEFSRVKRRNSSFSSLWSGITRRNTMPGPETSLDPESSATKRNEDGEDEGNRSQTPRPIQRKPSIFSIFTPSRPTTPTTTPTTTTTTTTTPGACTPPATPSRSPTLTVSPPPSQRPSTPSRASTWGTSTTTLVPWLSRSSTFGPSKTADKGKSVMSEDCNGDETGGGGRNKREPMTEVVLARYTCVLSKRKAGRLVVDEDALGMVAGYVYGDDKVRYINPPPPSSSSSSPALKSSPSSSSLSPSEAEKKGKGKGKEIPEAGEIYPLSPPKEEQEQEGGEEEEEESASKPTTTTETETKTKAPWTASPPLQTDTLENLPTQKERLRHIIVGTCLCMVIAEKEKRDTAREIVLTILTEGQGS